MMLKDRHNTQIEFKLLELLNKVNQMLLKLEIEEFEFSNSKLFSEIGNKLDLLDIFLFKFKENDNLHHGHLYAYWRDKNSDKGELNLQNCFFEYHKQFENYFNSYPAFNLQEGIFKWKDIDKDFCNHTLFYLCVPIKLETGFKGFFILGSSKQFILESLEVHFLKIFGNNFGQFLNDGEKKPLSKQRNLSIDSLNGFYESILDTVPAYISVIDASQNYIYLSKSAIKDSELKTWLIGKNDFDYCRYRNKPLLLAENRKSLFEKVVEKREPYSIEEEFMLDNGQIKIELRLMTPVFENDILLYAIIYGIDITELKNKEDIITKQYHALENSPIGIALLDKEGKYFYMNPYHANIFGYKSEELMGKIWDMMYDEVEADKISKLYFPELMANGTWSGETRGRKKNGENIFQELVLSTFEDGGLACMTRDITAVKKELNTAQLMHNQFELALNSANLGMMQYSLNSAKIEFHQTFLKLIGYHPNEIPEITKNILFSLIHPEDREMVLVKLQDYIRNYRKHFYDENLRCECRLIHKKGHDVWVLCVGKINNHDYYGPIMTGFNIDISLIKEAENELKKSLEKEKQLNDLKSGFVSMASHEFRTPLSTIRLGVEITKKILDMDNLEAHSISRIHSKLDDILIDVDRMNELMFDVLTMGKIEASKVDVNMQKLSVNKLLLDFLKQNSNQEWTGHNIQLELSKKECFSCLDLKLMNQILTNLISNSVKYSEGHSIITIRSKIKKKQVVIEVEDCGFGISESDLPFVFDSFYRSKAVENITGTGLGMSKVKLFVEKNNGEIYVESTLNVGTKVTLIFPQV